MQILFSHKNTNNKHQTMFRVLTYMKLGFHGRTHHHQINKNKGRKIKHAALFHIFSPFDQLLVRHDAAAPLAIMDVKWR